MKLPGENTWSKGVCLRLKGIRSYEVQVNGKVYRRNRKQLRLTSELSPVEPEWDSDAEMEATASPESARSGAGGAGWTLGNQDQRDGQGDPEPDPHQPEPAPVRQSGRIRREPSRYGEWVK